MKYSTWLQLQKQQKDLISFPGKPFNIKVIQVYAPTTDAEKSEADQVYEILQDLIELTHTHTHTHTRYAFHHKGLGCKTGS